SFSLNDPPPSALYPLSLHDALPIFRGGAARRLGHHAVWRLRSGPGLGPGSALHRRAASRTHRRTRLTIFNGEGTADGDSGRRSKIRRAHRLTAVTDPSRNPSSCFTN